MAKAKKTYLISGGAGFVGSHLADELVRQGHFVVIIDDFSNGRKENVSQFSSRQAKVVRGDISWPLSRLMRIFRPYTFAGIFHLACWPRSLSLPFPQRDLEVNALGTLHMLQIAQQHTCKMVFTSNSGILGNPDYIPTDEKHADRPSTPYDANKLVGEYYCRIYSRIHKVPVGIVRFAAVYGDRQQIKTGWKPLIAEFYGKISKNKPVTINWDGKQTRDFLYVKDAVQGVLKAFRANTGDEYYLISSGVETSVNELFETICKIVGKHPSVKHAPKVPGDIRRMWLSHKKAQRVLGYRPKYSLRQGITNYIAWVREQS